MKHPKEENVHLIQMCLKKADGRNIHDVKNLISAYRMTIKIENLAGEARVPLKSRHWEKVMIDFLTTGELDYKKE